MGLLAIASMLGFLGVGSAVGVRLLWLARHTRRLPELFLGGGLASTTLVTFPTTVASVALGFGDAGLEKLLFAVGLVPVGLLVAGLYAFTWVVFRRESRACVGLVVAATAASAVVVVGLAHARITHWDGGALPAVKPWMLALVALFTAALAWTAFEALRYHALLRRRMALGLADPVVANRVFLWGFGALVSVLAMLLIGASKAAGLVIVVHPVPRLATGLGGIACALCWYLAFLPPKAYVERLRARFPAQAPSI